MTANELPSGWCASTYGEAMVEVEERAGEHTGLPVLSLTKAHGPMLASERFSKVLHSRDLSRYRIARRGQIVADPMLLWDGAIGVQRAVDAGLVSPDYRVYEPREKVDPTFLSKVVRSPLMLPYYQGGARGTNVRRNRITRSDFLRIPLSLPPNEEQRKITAILSAVDEAIEATQAVIDQLQIVKKAMMAELLTRGLPGRHTRFKKTEIGELPEGWSTATYGGLAASVPGAIQSGPFGSELRHSEFQPEGRLVIGIDNVRDGRFSLGANHRISEEKFRSLERFRARPLDLLITVMATVGRCCVVPADIEPAIITKHVYRLVVDRDRANPYFLMYCLYGVQRLAEAVRGSAQGLTRPGLNKALLLPLTFPLPPLAEQDQIVAALSSLDARISAEMACIAGLREVNTGVMSVLLTGEVRVTPDEAMA